MTAQVTFLPSGRTCAIEANETVLAACLRAGLSPQYGCSNGNCGACKATLKSGNIDQVRYHDFEIKGPQKLRGDFLMCANRALGDIEIEADVTQSPEDIPLQAVETKVKVVDNLDPQIIRLHLQTPRSRRLRFIAGQSVSLSIDGQYQSTHAIASCPCDDRNLFFHIPDIPGNAFSEYIFAGHLKSRQKVLLQGPQTGTFFLGHKASQPMLILCWHTTFAPVISLMELAMALEIEEDIHLYRLSPTPDRQYLANLCRAWSDAFDNINVTMLPTRFSLLSSNQDAKDILANIATRHPDIHNYGIYVAGPPNLAEAAEQFFAGYGLGNEHVRTHTESFGFFD